MIDLSRFSLDGRTTIITGGSGGIGRACAVAFAKARANIVIASLPDSIPPMVGNRRSRREGVGWRGCRRGAVKSMVEQSLAKFSCMTR
jgi:NAD(P)-dependent dehydrogenase (short-subunit alcohol dehydrogenase family)